MNIVYLFTGGIIAIIVAVIALNSIDFVQAGERGVTTHWGAVNPDEPPRTQGIQFKTPFQDNIVKMDIQTQKYPGSIDPDAGDEGQKGIRIASTSRDIQDVFTEVVVIYHLNGDSVNTLYANIGIDYETEVVQPILKQVAKQTMAQFSAEELVTERETLKERILASLGDTLDNLEQCKRCIVIEDIALTDIDFSSNFSEAIENKVRATQEAKKAENDLERIRFEAEQARVKAQGIADAKAIDAEGEAKYIETINRSIENNPDFLKWYQIARWDGAVPKVMGEGTNVLPLITVDNQR